MDIFLNMINYFKRMLKNKRGEERISDEVFSRFKIFLLELRVSRELKKRGFSIKKENGEKHIITNGYDIGHLTTEDYLPLAVLNRRSPISGLRPTIYDARNILLDKGYVLSPG